MPVSGEGVFILCSGFLSGFPMGSKNCAELLKANKIHPKEAEILFYITNNHSPVFIGSYILLQQLQLTGMFGISIFILYTPALILGMLLLHRKKEENRQKKTASQSQITFKIIDAAIMNGFETLGQDRWIYHAILNPDLTGRKTSVAKACPDPVGKRS